MRKQISFNELIKKIKDCEGCEFEFREAFEHAKRNPKESVYLSISWDDEIHIGIRVYDKKGRKIMG